MNLVTFCGSIGERSANRALLDAVTEAASERGWSTEDAEELSSIPLFDPSIGDDDAPQSVAALRRAFESADAVVLAVPEYGGGAAGWAKNALDWMVGSGSLYGRTAAVLCAGTTGGPNAIAQIARTLTWQGANVVATHGVAAPQTKRDGDGRTVDASTLAALDDLVRRLTDASRDPAVLDRLVTETLARLGIPRDDRRGA